MRICRQNRIGKNVKKVKLAEKSHNRINKIAITMTRKNISVDLQLSFDKGSRIDTVISQGKVMNSQRTRALDSPDESLRSPGLRKCPKTASVWQPLHRVVSLDKTL